MSELKIVNHPLVQHKISLLRDKNTNVKDFRMLINELTLFLGYEATKDISLLEKIIETPITVTDGKIIQKEIAVIAILRAGLGMVDAFLTLIPTAKIGLLGMYRDEATLQPVEYYNKIPKNIEDCEVFLTDPMLATGGSAILAIDYLKQQGSKIKLISIISSPEGAKAVQEKHPDVEIYTASLDEKLNSSGYIVPGVGDAGDRIFGTL